MAKGIDCGTSFFISAYLSEGKPKIRKQRNVFLYIDDNPVIVKRQLSRLKVPYIERENKIYIVGKRAFEYAQIFSGSDLKHPMKNGLLNPSEKGSLPILKVIIKELLGSPDKKGETCVFCVPAESIDRLHKVDYHEGVLKMIIEDLGYNASKIHEAVALGYEGLQNQNYTGVAISFGAGMINVAIMYAGLTALTFSVAKGGDFIDENASIDTGVPQAKITYIKESEDFDMLRPKSQDEHAIKTYYGVLIDYVLKNISHQFKNIENMPTFPDPVDIVCGGGTAMPKGFIDVFKERFQEMEFPLKVKNIRLVKNPHIAVALGCLNEALICNTE